MEEKVGCVILAGGFGHFDGVPKVLSEIREGETILARVIRTCYRADVECPIVVVQSHYETQLRAAIEITNIPCEVAVQPLWQQGKEGGGALAGLQCAAHLWRCYDTVIVIFADMPGWQSQTLRGLRAHHLDYGNTATVGTFRNAPYFSSSFLEHTKHWGRVRVQEGSGRVLGIYHPGEILDEEFAKLSYRSPSLYCLRTAAVQEHLSRVPPSGPKQERSIPHLINLLVGQCQQKVGYWEISDPTQAIGINAPEDLAFWKLQRVSYAR